MSKKIFALALSLALLASMAVAMTGCQTAGQPSAPAPSASAAGSGSAAPDNSAPATVGKTTQLIWFMGDPGKVPVDQEKVEAELNKISAAKLGVTVKTLYFNDEKMKLALSAGDPWDICFTCEWMNSFADQAAAGYFADITDKVKTVTPALYQTMPDIVWEGAKINGKIYAIPVKKDYACEMFFRFDKALFVDDLKMDIPEKMTFADIEKYLKAAKDAFTAGDEKAKQAEYPLMLSKGGYQSIDSEFDLINRDMMLGIPYSAVGTPDETKVELIIEDKQLQDRFGLLRSWFNAGYINKDAATLESDAAYSAVKVGQGFYGADSIWSGQDGYTQVISKYSGPYLSAQSIRGSMNAISARSANIDLALKYQELVNTDLEYRDMLRYGIPGVHWNKTSEGLAERTQTGRDNYVPWAFSQGSYSLSTPEAAEGVKVDPKMWEVIFDGYKEAKGTKTIGFSFDTTNVQTEMAACKVVKDKYWVGLDTGTLDPATTIPQMISELETAGIRTIQKACQDQFDAWLAANGKK